MIMKFLNGEMGTRHHSRCCLNFREALRVGNLEVLQKLVKYDKDFLKWVIDTSGNLPLHSAIENEYEEVAKFLVNKKPKTSIICNYRKETPLYKAITKGQSSLVSYMLQSLGKYVDLNVGKSILHAALALQHPYWQDIVDMLLKHQENLLICWDDLEIGLSPLSWAIQRDNGQALVEYLLNNFPGSMNIRNKDYNCSYPIHKAWESGRLEILRALYLRNPNSILKADRFNQTILHYAAAKNPCDDESCYREMLSFLQSLPEVSQLFHVFNLFCHTPFKVAVSKKNHLFLQYF